MIDLVEGCAEWIIERKTNVISPHAKGTVLKRPASSDTVVQSRTCLESYWCKASWARAGSSVLAQSGFAQTKQGVSRQDAVYYCLDAMRRFAQMSPDAVQKLTLELAMAGRNGFAVHNPESRYDVKGLDGDFSGLAMVCFLYVAMERMAPGTGIGFDLAAEYEQAKEMFKAQS